ncbi:MAG: SRPBCC family protein [Methylicorpusculum sp.]|uniref:SRPBCC family protein n=2 Tax=Methylicorpusculum sp. TaxID=2713644 RepID=UPI0027240D7E|nr:SRPBCC family protein [Methylicorpusculum sp.]MDO8845784.1 SRPBCC family protein [Methylicorpusculum sp.]MDO8937887.1 SRPBCC family protein [Methylicorpusculum sp.]MDO9240336.1 SRPBCC family protein [Methylicorpusculum sp.]MDP2177965.1 SRPBCC family protein [Methylicorpusculum sp.]MDP2200656.1 SRPBCC family protein [Methylicorpusculum sp.]
MFGLSSNHAATGTASIVVNKPIDHVFKFIGIDFFENYPRWSPEVRECELLSDPPLQLNSFVRQVRVDQGQRSESTFKVTVFKPERQLVFEGVSNAYRCSYDLLALQTSTELIFTFELLKLELFMLPFEKLIGIAVQDGAKRTVRNLKTLLEAG